MKSITQCNIAPQKKKIMAESTTTNQKEKKKKKKNVLHYNMQYIY